MGTPSKITAWRFVGVHWHVMHSALKARAAGEGMSLPDSIKRKLERAAERPSMREWLQRTRQTKAISSRLTAAQAAQVIRGLREVR